MSTSASFHINTMSEMVARGEHPEILFWVGCAGSFDDRSKRVTIAICKILQKAQVKFAVLGTEESCSGDPARRSGNEFLFQMQALSNIQMLNLYEVKKIITACPHCFNTLKNEYPILGGHYEVMHHSEFLQSLIHDGRLKIQDDQPFKGKRLTFHDSCYLGRANSIYEIPRQILEALDTDLVEMKHHKKAGMCCGAGGAQLFKEPEKGKKDIHIARTEEALATDATSIVVGCPFCLTMLTDGIKSKKKEDSIQIYDLAEVLTHAL